MASPPSKPNNEKSAYAAFNAVDATVSKPILGSDGAGRWQDFRQNNKQLASRTSVAPTAPLKATDRKSGFTTWGDERKNEATVRTQAGDAALNAGYTTFKSKTSAEEAARLKREKHIRKRIRPDEAEYYIPQETFGGYKFDYIFTTKDRRTGYYWDGMDSIKKLESGGADGDGDTTAHGPSVVAGMSSRQAADESTTSQQQQQQYQPPASNETLKPKKKKRKKEKPVILSDPNNPMEQVAAALQRRQAEATSSAWEEAVDPTSGKTYYYCRATGERKWDKPPPALPAGWQSAKDASGSGGKEYFYNAASGETKWERPT